MTRLASSSVLRPGTIPKNLPPRLARSYRRDFWTQQPVRVEVWSEKGTVRGVLATRLDEYAVGFRVMHGFSGATTIHDVAEDDDGRDLIVFYVGDYDPSGLYMSEHDLPDRLTKYGGDHVDARAHRADAGATRRPAIVPRIRQAEGPTATSGSSEILADRCWELDAMDPNDLRALVEEAIRSEIEPIAWERCDLVNQAEQESLQTILAKWRTRRERAHHPIPSAHAAAIFISEAARAAGSCWRAITDGCTAIGARRSRMRNGWHGISGCRCGRRHDCRRARPSHARCGPAFLGRAESAPLEQEGIALGHQRRPQRRCRQGHLVRPRGQRRRRRHRFPQARGRRRSVQWLRENGFGNARQRPRKASTRSSRPTTTPTNPARCCSRSAASSRRPSASGAGHARTTAGQGEGWLGVERQRRAAGAVTACPS